MCTCVCMCICVCVFVYIPYHCVCMCVSVHCVCVHIGMCVCVYLENILWCLKSIISYTPENLIFGILKIKRKKWKRKVGRIKRRAVKEADFFPRTLALYNLFIFSAQEDHTKPEWNLKDNLSLEPVIPKWNLCVLTFGALLLSLIVWTANCPQKKWSVGMFP